ALATRWRRAGCAKRGVSWRSAPPAETTCRVRRSPSSYLEYNSGYTAVQLREDAALGVGAGDALQADDVRRRAVVHLPLLRGLARRIRRATPRAPPCTLRQILRAPRAPTACAGSSPPGSPGTPCSRPPRRASPPFWPEFWPPTSRRCRTPAP